MPDRKRQKRTADVRARAEAKRAESRRAERARSLRFYVAGGGITTVSIVVIVLLIVSQTRTAKPGPSHGVIDPVVSIALATIPASTYDVASATQGEGIFEAVTKATPLTSKDKPVVIYVGAEYCPFCAAERWALAAALARFGTFTGLQKITSTGADEFPNTATLTFLTAEYSSRYLVFDSTEIEDRAKNALQPLTSGSKAAFELYNYPPYTTRGNEGSIPFLDVANVYIAEGAQYSPSILAGRTADYIAQDLSHPTSKISTIVLGSANVITAAICKVLPSDDRPPSVCTSRGVATGMSALTAGTSSGDSSS